MIEKLGQHIGFLATVLRMIRKPVLGMPESANGGIRAAAYALMFICGMTQVLADVQYVYDESDRLVELIDASGNSAQYRYDSSGNIEAILRYAAGDVAIAEFTPNKGPVGTAVTIYGVGFSPTPSSNAVQFNGVPATVSSAGSTKLVAKVPTGATTGPISITVGAQAAASASSFVVTAGALNAPPSITGFTPANGATGAVVTITGNNFDTVPANNVIWFNTALATINTSSKTQIAATVPDGATSGHVKVRTPYGTAISSADFIIPPTDEAKATNPPTKYTINQIGFIGRTEVSQSDWVPLSVNIGTVGQVALVLFDGAKGQNLDLTLTNDTFGGTTSIYVYKPDGALLASTSLTNPNTTGLAARNALDLTNLPATGTYSVLINPQGAIGSIDVKVWEEQTGSLAVDTSYNPISLGEGQKGRYTFSGSIYDYQGVGLGVTDLSLMPSQLASQGKLIMKVYGPDGALLYTCPNLGVPGGTCDPSLPPTGAGVFTVLLDTSNAAGVSLRLWASTDATGELNSNPQIFTANQPGQNARYRFTASKGQSLSLKFTDDTIPGATYFHVYKPDGTLWTSTSLNYTGGSAPPASSTWTLTFPETGDYRLLVSPSGTVIGSISVNLQVP